jgi:biopolymer transport protein TolQ
MDNVYLQSVLDASIVVQLVILTLLSASLLSWAVIWQKRAELKKARDQSRQFETLFWSGGSLEELYRKVEGNRGQASGMENIFEFGFREFARLVRQPGMDATLLMDGARRAMRVAQLRELDKLELRLELLATVGSISPYIGLFGTVWGIMHAFHGLAGVQTATLQMVAPGISEALIATAIGLAAAIPAVVAYNRFSNHVARLELRFDTFVEEFSTILQRHAKTSQKGV